MVESSMRRRPSTRTKTSQALLGYRLVVGLVSLAILLITLPLLIRYPITRRSHPERRQKLDSVGTGAATDA